MSTATVGTPTTRTAADLAPLAITAVGAVTPAGLGLEALGRAVAAGLPGHAEPPVQEGETLPPRPARAVPDLKVAELIGRKGTRHLDRTTKLGLVACRLALDSLPSPVGSGTGVVLGTSTGSIRSSSEYSLETLRQERPYLVNPSLFPNTVMNCAAGQIAIRHGLKGVNATLAGGHLAGVQVLRYARNALRQGHADRLLVGGVEEFCAQSAWGWHQSGSLTADAAVGEGAAVLVVEPEEAARAAGRRVLARVLACETGYAARGSLTQGLASVIGLALERSGRTPAEVTSASLGSTGHVGLDRIEERALHSALGGRLPDQVIRVKESVGECFSAGGVLQIAGLLGLWQQEGAGTARTSVVTAVSRDGQVGCVVLDTDALAG
ncbi:beta-ketoacyl synthase N-terminal-like domain-containing protein [Streptomyces sp. NPDC057616]|uniref:beta-ketoacyl synthase N-terminal-like domain-containing protein n=1 Tax=Streptomyces sp. NPDC057616 TaxID=3346183 RepID=UPI003689C7F1